MPVMSAVCFHCEPKAAPGQSAFGAPTTSVFVPDVFAHPGWDRGGACAHSTATHPCIPTTQRSTRLMQTRMLPISWRTSCSGARTQPTCIARPTARPPCAGCSGSTGGMGWGSVAGREGRVAGVYSLAAPGVVPCAQRLASPAHPLPSACPLALQAPHARQGGRGFGAASER